MICGLFGDGIIKLRVTAVYRCEEAVKFYGMLVDPILDPESTVIKLKEVYFAKECNSS